MTQSLFGTGRAVRLEVPIVSPNLTRVGPFLVHRGPHTLSPVLSLPLSSGHRQSCILASVYAGAVRLILSFRVILLLNAARIIHHHHSALVILATAALATQIGLRVDRLFGSDRISCVHLLITSRKLASRLLANVCDRHGPRAVHIIRVIAQVTNAMNALPTG